MHKFLNNIACKYLKHIAKRESKVNHSEVLIEVVFFICAELN